MRTLRTLPALLLATGALTIAATGGAVAGTVITGAQIKDSSVTGADIKDRTLSVKDLATASVKALQGQDGAAGADGAQGPQGPQGVAGPQGISGPVSGYEIVINSLPVAAGVKGAHVEAFCPAGKRVVGGGGYWQVRNIGVGTLFGNDRVSVFGDAEAMTGDTLKVSAICVNA